MIKITKTGTIPEPKIWDGRCDRCGSEATADETDLDAMTMLSDYIAYYKCPVCNCVPHMLGPFGMVFRERQEGDAP